ncbi:MAG: hypothetical protein JST58_04835 [Bacteroidetes bacterium]|nr:hypothetical protein [Bacteroidota bacterium]
MKSILFIFSFVLVAYFASAQVYVTIVFHTDLPVRQIENTAVKQACLTEYGAKLKQIENDRAVTSADLALVEEIQAKFVKSFANCDDAIRNCKSLYYAFQRLPKIYDNLQKAAELATNKPYLIPLATNAGSIIATRLGNLVDYIKNTVTNNDYGVFIDQAKRDKLIIHVCSEINTLYSYSSSLYNKFNLYTIQDAVNQVVPYKNMANQDMAIINNIKSTFKF